MKKEVNLKVHGNILKLNVLESFHVLLLIIILLWFSNEFVRTSISFYVISFIYLIWITLSILRRPKFIDIILGSSLFLILWVLSVISRSLIRNSGLSYEVIYSITLLMILTLFLYYKDKGIRIKKIIFFTIMIGYISTGIVTLVFLNIDPDLVRYAGAGLTQTEGLINEYGNGIKFIGSWDYIYSLVGTVIICILIALVNIKTRISLIYFILAIFFTIIVFQSSLSTAIFLLLILIVLILIPKRKKMKIMYFSLILTILALLVPLSQIIISFLSLIIDNPAYFYKIIEFQKLLSGEYQSFSQFYGRSDLVANSLVTFIKNPLLGVYGILPYEMVSNHNIVSGHSQWFDDLARYGIISSMFFWIGIFKISKVLRKYASSRIHKKFVNIILLYVLLLGFLNPALLTHIFILVFLVLPFSSSIGRVQEKDDSNIIVKTKIG
ncbi:hypothetical protein [Planococcus sp. 107-1]|uniref:hypothetical protein n=1 Tax=Planococcus sp. 107-1 TaxID=2908840 RepID=UPI001F194D76|nr:hypothetical protein [Planococcus sp. 107-1]UJF26166.1 hypothetical protein L0M13_13445 [Planococcus sp. 107-1]